MEKPLLIKSIFMFLCIWGICLTIIWFRKNLEIFWKILATLIYIFYAWFFYEEILSGYRSFTMNWWVMSVDFIKELVAISFANLFLFWPIALLVIFYKSDDMAAEKLLKFMCIITLVLWIIFIIYVFCNRGIDKFLYDNLRKAISSV